MPAHKTAASKSSSPSANAFNDQVRKVCLASVGACALSKDDLKEFVEKLVEKGEMAEKDGKSLISEVVKKSAKKAETLGEDLKHAKNDIDGRVESLIGRFKFPSRRDIDTLSRKIEDLSKRVDSLSKNKR